MTVDIIGLCVLDIIGLIFLIAFCVEHYKIHKEKWGEFGNNIISVVNKCKQSLFAFVCNIAPLYYILLTMITIVVAAFCLVLVAASGFMFYGIMAAGVATILLYLVFLGMSWAVTQIYNMLVFVCSPPAPMPANITQPTNNPYDIQKDDTFEI